MKYTGKTKRIPVFMILFFLVLITHAQDAVESGPEFIKNLIASGKIEKANQVLKEEIAAFQNKGNYDTLVSYIPLAGSFTLARDNSEEAISKATELTRVITNEVSSEIKAKALLQLSNIHYSARQNDKVKEITTEGLKYAMEATPRNELLIASLQYSIGTANLNLGKYEEARPNLIRSKEILEELPEKNLRELYSTYNSIGRYFSSKSQLDSSTTYYKKAISVLDQMDKTEENRDYWKAIVHNNISLNLQNTGNTNEAITYIKRSIENYQEFVDVATDESKKSRAIRFRLSSIDNLGTFYHGLGEYNKAVEIFTYSYQQKLDRYGEEDPNVVFSLVILSHGHLSAKNYKIAGEFADRALRIIDKNPSNFAYLHSYILSVRASIHKELGQKEQAQVMYEKSEALYMRNFNGTYSKDYLDTMINMSLFYSKTGNTAKAISFAEAGYNYTQREEYQNTLIRYSHVQNMADVNFELKDYENALQYSEQALNFFRENELTATSLADSIQIEFNKPRSLLIYAKSKFHLQENKSEPVLLDILAKVKEAIGILERRKAIVNSPEDLQILIENNYEVFDFAKKLYLNLFELTDEEKYMIDLVTMHESSMYSRIRSRLNIRSMSFSDVPKDVLMREEHLRKNISVALNNPSEEDFNVFFDATTSWNQFKDSLKLHFPRYYKMRYATIESSLNDLQQKISENTTLIRYLFIDAQLYAFVVSKEQKSLFSLNFENVKENIPKLTDNDFDAGEVSDMLTQLYDELWKPFDDTISTERVIIIPDRELYNLSFELLTSTPIERFRDLATKGLLARYSISYNFSLLIENDERTTINAYPRNFVAFVPEFSEAMKDNYKVALTDSVSLDRNYLTLLPQPFSVDVASYYSRIFHGDSFLNENASKEVFISNAGEHKIIHIGTHAESNNVSPELSRLIFAKNISDKDKLDDNYLFTYEIYNYDLSSDLAILTACETGKPSYQAGEGMISLAHAFTYAGSESILTSLWKIDEKSSNEILGYFYENLKDGIPKDEALRQAKLTYLSTAQGRTLAPQYWSGLILMGDPQPIALHTEFPFWPWFIGGILLLVLILIFFRMKPSDS